jgi:hypothetical protein
MYIVSMEAMQMTNETKQASWLESLTEETRQRVFAVMRKVRDESTRYCEKGYTMNRGTGITIPVGAAGFDEIVRGEVLASYLRALGKGQCPTEAIEYAKREAREMVKSHNGRRKDYTWQRADMTADSTVEYAHNRVVDAVVGR